MIAVDDEDLDHEDKKYPEAPDGLSSSATLRRIQDIIESLPAEETEAYRTAAACAKEIVERESNPFVFLEFDKGDVEKAARRLATYWKERVACFGDRAFLPLLDCTGKGAMSSEDIDLMNMGVTTELPVDEKGRPVILHDVSSIEVRLADHRASRKAHAFFFFGKVFVEHPVARQEGVVILRVFKDPYFDRALFKHLQSLSEESMPIRFSSIHFCCLPKPEAWRHFLDLFAPLVHRLAKEFPGLVYVHVLDSPAKMLQRLRTYHLTPEGLPSSLGGNWKPAEGCNAEPTEEYGDRKRPALDNIADSASYTLQQSPASKKRAQSEFHASEHLVRQPADRSFDSEHVQTDVVREAPSAAVVLEALTKIQQVHNVSIRSILKKREVRGCVSNLLDTPHDVTEDARGSGASGGDPISAGPALSMERRLVEAEKKNDALRQLYRALLKSKSSTAGNEKGDTLANEHARKTAEQALTTPHPGDQRKLGNFPLRESLVSKILEKMRKKARPT